MSKPTNKPGWNPTNATEPSASKKAQGWAAGEKPAAEHFNWLMKTVSEWIDYVDTAGVQGPQGEQGPAGPQGPAGSVDTSTLSTINSRLDALEDTSGVIPPSPVTVQFPYNGGAAPGEYDAAGVLPGSSKTIDWSNGGSQSLLLDADCALSFTNAVAGNTYYLRIQQGGYGLKRITSWPANISWASGSVPTISTAAWTTDVIGVYFNGANYYGYVSQGHFVAPSGIETKKGYIAGGAAGTSSVVNIGTVERINFNSDQTLEVVQTEFGYTLNQSGTYAYPSIGANNYGVGTQSATHGYRLSTVYTSLPSLSGFYSDKCAHKLSFSNDTQSSIVRLAAAPVLFGHTRRGVTQNSLAVYMPIGHASYSFSKMIFSTEAQSNVGSQTGLTVNGNGYVTGGCSTAEVGIYFGGLWGSGTNAYKTALLNFSTELYSVGPYQIPFNAVVSEVVDSEYNGYWQGTSSNSSPYASNCRKIDKSTYTFNLFSNTLTGGGTASTAVQGASAGYFCGGQLGNSTDYFAGGTSTTAGAGVTYSAIKRVDFAPETYSIHGASLQTARYLAAGFEG